jgi:hypothetical protein
VAFPVPIASVLTGATIAQLAYWRKDTPSAPALLVPEGKRSGRYLYSWADVVALRSIVYVRSEKSLPRIRRAVATLRALEADEWTHLAVAALADDDLDADEIAAIYPSVQREAIADATAFAEQVAAVA